MKTYTEEEVRLLMIKQAKIVRSTMSEKCLAVAAKYAELEKPDEGDVLQEVASIMMFTKHDWVINPKKTN